MRDPKLVPSGHSQVRAQAKDAPDPVLEMLGVGKEIWAHETAGRFVERLRSEEVAEPPRPSPPSDQIGDLQRAVWSRIETNQGAEFQTVTGLPFTFQVDGN